MTPLELADEPPRRVRFLNSVFDAERRFEIPIGDQPHQVRFHADFTPLRAGFGFQVTGSESQELWVTLAETSRLTGIEAWLDDATLDQLPEEVAAIALDDCLAAALEALGASVGESFKITRVCATNPNAELEYSLPFLLTNADGESTRGMLVFGEDWAPTIKSLVACAPIAATEELESVRIPAPIELGRSWLTLAELDALELYGLVAIDQSDYLSAQRATLFFPNALQVECDTGDEGLVVRDILAPAPHDPRSAPESLDSFDETRLPLMVHAGQAQPTLGQLRRLSRGDQIDVRGPARKTVDVVVADRPIGEGELVQCGDRLGVRLLTLISNQQRGLPDAAAAGE